MESIYFSNQETFVDYDKYVDLLKTNKGKILRSIKKVIRLKLANKKLLTRIYNKLLRLKTFRTFFNSNYIYIINYWILKKYYFGELFSFLGCCFNLQLILLATYHYLYIYKALFLLKMTLEWFPIRNWQAASPLKRFLWRSTRRWTAPFEKVLPSILAWIIVIQIMPKLYKFIAYSFYQVSKSSFVGGPNFQELVELVAYDTLPIHSFSAEKAEITLKYLFNYLFTLKFIGV